MTKNPQFNSPLTDIYDNIRNGAHLIMAYDPASNSFKGTVTNTTAAILPLVRVEIHLSKGGVTTAELGPTTPTDLAPGETQNIVLMAEGPPFDMWTAHPEVGPMSGGGGEGGAEGPEGGEGGGEGGGEAAKVVNMPVVPKGLKAAVIKPNTSMFGKGAILPIAPFFHISSSSYILTLETCLKCNETRQLTVHEFMSFKKRVHP